MAPLQFVGVLGSLHLPLTVLLRVPSWCIRMSRTNGKGTVQPQTFATRAKSSPATITMLLPAVPLLTTTLRRDAILFHTVWTGLGLASHCFAKTAITKRSLSQSPSLSNADWLVLTFVVAPRYAVPFWLQRGVAFPKHLQRINHLVLDTLIQLAIWQLMSKTHSPTLTYIAFVVRELL